MEVGVLFVALVEMRYIHAGAPGALNERTSISRVMRCVAPSSRRNERAPCRARMNSSSTSSVSVHLVIAIMIAIAIAEMARRRDGSMV